MTSADKAKPPPPPTLTQLSPEALVETIDGPVRIVELVGKVMPVLTRAPGKPFGFRMMREIRQLAEAVPLLRLRNDEGQEVVVGADHVFVRMDGSEVRAGDLRTGERLAQSWTYDAGYLLPDAEEYAAGRRGQEWVAGVHVRSVEPAGEGPVIGLSVNETKAYYLTFGARCRAQA